MRYGRVNTLAISGLKNKIHQFGDKVNEDQFYAGHFDALVKSGALELLVYEEDQVPARPMVGPPVVIPKPVEDKPEGLKQKEKTQAIVTAKKERKEKLESSSVDESNDSTRDEIMAELDKLKVKYSKNESKNELYAKWRAANKKT